MFNIRGQILLLLTAVDLYVGHILLDEWYVYYLSFFDLFDRHSACEFRIQSFVLYMVLFGFPSTVAIEAARAQKGFRMAFALEVVVSFLTVLLLSLGSYYMTKYSGSTCQFTAPRLWSISYWSVAITWTIILMSACLMLVTSTVALVSPTRAPGVQRSHSKVNAGTKYGTL
jgi:hypothetical protein